MKKLDMKRNILPANAVLLCMRQRAFTLLELLVAIVLLAVFVLLIVSVSGSIRRSAMSAQSANNLRQIGVALSSFVADQGGEIMPRVYASTAPAGQSRYWVGTLYNRGYLRDKRVFYDPRFAPFSPEKAIRAIETGTPETYGMRDWVRPGEKIGSTTARVAKRVNVIDEPGQFFIVTESYWVAWNTQGYAVSPGVNGDNRVRLDREGYANTLFLDGHVEKKPGEYFEALGETQGQYSDNQPFSTWRTP